MNEIWANRLTAETKFKTWNDVPASRKAGVKAVLAGRVSDGIITAEKYHEITGEAYTGDTNA